jgi:hypothetical protein
MGIRRIGRDPIPGSARVSRAGEGVSPSRTFTKVLQPPNTKEPEQKFVSARRRNQHAISVRSPENDAAAPLTDDATAV